MSEISELEQQVIERAKISPFMWLTYATGKPLAEHHKVWLANFFDPNRKRINLIGPRESAKTTILIYALAWLIGKNPLLTNALASVSLTQAKKRLSMLRSIVLSQQFKHVFPNVGLDKNSPDTQTEFSVRYTDMSPQAWIALKSQHGSLKDPTIGASGRGSKSAIGNRISGWLLFDDLVDESDASPYRQQAVLETIMQVFEPLVQAEGKIINIGTRWIEHDIYGELAKNEEWHTIVIPAILKDENGNPRSYWPEYWPLEKLEEKRRRMKNDALFRIMYLCDPTALSSSLFRPEMFHAGVPDFPSEFTSIIISTDLARSVAKHADYTAFVAIGEKNGEHYLLDVDHFKDTETQGIQRLAKMHTKLSTQYPTNHISVLFEDIGFQATYAQLMQASAPHITSIPLRPKGDKTLRAQVVSHFLTPPIKFHIRNYSMPENFRTPYLDVLYAEMLNYPNHPHDDILDAIGLYFQLQGGQGTGPSASFRVIRPKRLVM